MKPDSRTRTLAALLLLAAGAMAQSVETVQVVSRNIARTTRLPGELLPYLKTAVQARVTGFVESIEVDRGSRVTKGQAIAKLSAPELAAQIAEAEAKVSAVESQKAEAEARLAAARSTFERLKTASQTPGVIAANELVVSENTVKAVEGTISALASAASAARAAIQPLREMETYLEVKAPFDGVVVERLVHPGALVGPGAQGNPPLALIEEHDRLRLVVAVPEADISGVSRGASVNFRVPTHAGRNFAGRISRTAHSLDPKTRTMPVEADVVNRAGALAPGMYAEVDWPVRRTRPSLLVPPTAVATNTERSFVIRVNAGKAEWVNVSKGAVSGDLVEVLGALEPGDVVIRRATDEIREGSPVAALKR